MKLLRYSHGTFPILPWDLPNTPMGLHSFIISGENVVLKASYRRVGKDINTFTSLLPFFGTDYGLCTLIKPQITFDPELDHVPFEWLMRNYTNTIQPGIQLGKENGLSILLDAEVSHTVVHQVRCPKLLASLSLFSLRSEITKRLEYLGIALELTVCKRVLILPK